MAGSVRVNLSVPERVDAVVSAQADMTGRSKAAVIMEAVGYFLPQWERDIRREQFSRRREGAAPPSGGSQAVAPVEPSAGAENASKTPPFTPQEQWNADVERKKAAKAGASGG